MKPLSDHLTFTMRCMYVERVANRVGDSDRGVERCKESREEMEEPGRMDDKTAREIINRVGE